MDLNSIEFYAILLAVAFAFLGIMYSPKVRGAATTKIASSEIAATAEGERSVITLTSLPGGTVQVLHDNFLLHTGDTVNIVVTVTGDNVLMQEKKGVMTDGGELRCTGTTPIDCIKQRTFNYRFESEVSGQWCTFQFCNVEGNQKTIELRY